MTTDMINMLRELQEIRETTARQVRDALEQMEPEERECTAGCGPQALMEKVRRLIDETHSEEGRDETECPNLARNRLDALIYHVLGGTADALGIKNY